MKINILFMFFVLGTIGSVTGQKQVIKTEKGEYHRDSRLNDYLGTWQYKNGGETFRIRLLPKRFELPEGTFTDMIQGFHQHVIDGAMIESSMDKTDIDEEGHFRNITMGGLINDEGFLELSFSNLTKDKKGIAKIRFLDKEHTKAQWTLGEYEREGINVITRPNPQIGSEKGFSVPTNVVLIRMD